MTPLEILDEMIAEAWEVYLPRETTDSGRAIVIGGACALEEARQRIADEV